MMPEPVRNDDRLIDGLPKREDYGVAVRHAYSPLPLAGEGTRRACGSAAPKSSALICDGSVPAGLMGDGVPAERPGARAPLKRTAPGGKFR